MLKIIKDAAKDENALRKVIDELVKVKQDEAVIAFADRIKAQSGSFSPYQEELIYLVDEALAKQLEG